jgi:aspartyl-tRNA(Asn)/glutamyl-tRNA(Gln) amidotransferase subunit A
MFTPTAIGIRKQFLSKELSAVEIINECLDRINLHNPKLNAFITVYHERAVQKAKELDARFENGEKVGRLAGIPIAIKDNIHVKGEISTCASKFLENFRPPFDSTVVRLLEAEDAIIIGKTNLDEFAMGSSNENSAMGVVRNPWNLNCVPGGSSGGSAAVVAAGMVPLSLGSDTGGSIRQPASHCGCFGLKPTYGRVSRYGLVAFASSLDQIGPFARNMEDIGLIMEVIGQHCSQDSTSSTSASENYLTQYALEGKLPLKVGVPKAYLKDLTGDAKSTFEESIETFKRMKAEIIDIDLDILKYSLSTYYILQAAEASTNLARFDGIKYGKRSEKAETLDEVYELSKEEGFGPEVKRRIMLGTFVLSSGYQDAFYKKSQQMRTLMLKQFKVSFQNCDVIAMPTCPTPAFPIGQIKDPLQMYLEDIYTICANLTGTPAISIPAGMSKNKLPLGLQLIAGQKEDVKLCSIANAFSKEHQFAPGFPSLREG